MPQSVLETLLWDVVQGLHPLSAPEILRRWLRTALPQARAISAPGSPAPPHKGEPGRSRAKERPTTKG